MWLFASLCVKSFWGPHAESCPEVCGRDVALRPPTGRTLGFADVHLAGAAAVGGGRDDVLRGSWLAGSLLLQLFTGWLDRVLGLTRLFGLQLGLTVGDYVVRL